VHAHFGLLGWPAMRKRFGELCCLSDAGRAAVERAMAPVGKAGLITVLTANLAASDPDPGFRIAGPMLLVMGRDDSNGEPIWKTFRAFQRAYPDAPAVIIADAGHCAHLDQPDAFIEAVSEFLNAVPNPPPQRAAQL
jgi:pimeloyl-ACP methyl ester carboxylesterase